MQAPTESKKRLALAVIDFLGSSLKDGTLTADDVESIEIAQSCIADTFKVDPSDEAAVKDAVGGQSLVNIYSVYEKLRGKSAAAPSTTTETTTTTTQATTKESTAEPAAATKKPGTTTAESDKLKSAGNAAMGRKDYSTAIDLYTQALAVSASNPVYLSNRAAAYSACGQHSKAVEDAELAVSVDPKYSKAWSRLGLARFDMADYNGAMVAYEKGIEAEGNGGSDAMKRGLETSKTKLADLEGSESAESPAAAGVGAGGLPDLSSLANMLGGGGGAGGGGPGAGGMPDLGSLMSNPMFAGMARNLMSNPEMLNNIMSNPRLRQMADSFGSGGGMPDMSSLMSDPNIADM